MLKPFHRLLVGGLFIFFYIAFCLETGALFAEFQAEELWYKLAFIYSHNFIFFPIAGLLALIAFFRPATLVCDALLNGRIRGGRAILAIGALGAASLSWLLADAFAKSNARSLFEIAPAAILADAGDATSTTAPRAPVHKTLMKLRVQAATEEGLSAHQIRCESDWLLYAPVAERVNYCFVADRELSTGDCCRAKTAFRENLNAMQAESPSQLAAVHRIVLPIKIFFMLLLLGLGVLLVRFRKRLTELYGGAIDEISFPLAAGGAAMLIWPLLNGAYLQTFSVLTGDGAANSYRVTAPLFSLGFGTWAMLLIFFHLRSYPSQMEYAAKFGGLIIAGFGVIQYQGIIDYLSQTLGAGGGVVAFAVYLVLIVTLIAAVLMGVRPQDVETGLKSATLIGDGALEAQRGERKPAPKG
ncbi:MAG: hypothetical protein AAFX03_10645 [Pseudomonadota bacterium]